MSKKTTETRISYEIQRRDAAGRWSRLEFYRHYGGDTFPTPHAAIAAFREYATLCAHEVRKRKLTQGRLRVAKITENVVTETTRTPMGYKVKKEPLSSKAFTKSVEKRLHYPSWP